VPGRAVMVATTAARIDGGPGPTGMRNRDMPVVLAREVWRWLFATRQQLQARHDR